MSTATAFPRRLAAPPSSKTSSSSSPHRRRVCPPIRSASVTDFASRVAGEWIGHKADFAPDGEPLSLPSHLVPDAYREWGQDIKDWQTQCSTTVRPARDETGGEVGEGGRLVLYAKDARFVPVVGCEADASTIESAEKHEFALDALATDENADGGACFGCYSGSYLDARGSEIVTHCVVANTSPPIRVRLSHRADGAGVVSVWREALDDVFTDGGVLASSCGGNSAVANFAEYPRDAEDRIRGADASFLDKLPPDATFLPVGIWFHVEKNDNAGEHDGSYASTLGYINEDSREHVVSVRSKSPDGVVRASFERRPCA